MFDSDLESLLPPIITEEDNRFLCCVPTKEEIYKTIKQMGASKALRPDGMKTSFYQKY